MHKNSFALDVNVWISIFINKQLSLIEDVVNMRAITIYRSTYLTNELQKVLKYKKLEHKWNKPIEEYLQFYKDHTVDFPTVPVFTDCPDPKDNYLFDLAIQSQADYLVTGDQTVLETPINPPTKIISFTEFKEMFV